MNFELEKLQYEYNALEPVIDELTVRTHHDKHHQGYVNNLNKVIQGTGLENQSIEYILKNLDEISAEKRGAVRNNGGGHYNHKLYWEIMTPGGANEPIGNLKEAIEETFGSFEAFKEAFENKGSSQFGSGWASLVKKDGKLFVVNNPNQDSPISDGYNVIINNDVWEHAYYITYQNRRADYLKEWWKLVNWDIAEARFNEK